MVEESIYKLKKLLKELSSIKGRHTELVSVYVPSGYSLNEIMTQIRNEQGTAINIKSKSTRKNVLGALEKILQHLKIYKQTPENGLAVFAGNISEQEGISDIKLWAVEPPEPLKTKLYWCDQRFELEPLREMIAEKELYGLVVMDNREASIGLLKGKKINLLRRLESIVPGKTSKGGQSAQRYERVREGLIADFYKKISDTIRELIPKNVKGIILGGPGPAKNEFYEKGYLQTDIKNQILGIKNIGYTDEHGLEELVQKSQDLLAEASVAKEKALVQRFFEELQKDSGLVTYGFDSVLKALERGAVEIILISEDLEHKGKDVAETLEKPAKKYGAIIEIISKDTREGEQLFELGGIAALLRYKIE
ncbi:MAG: peptide chain release factor aRF-1 [Candidatus Aenigmatarchaeota archaeon]